MFDSQKVVDANFIVSFDTPYTELCDEIIKEFEQIIDNNKGTTHYMNGALDDGAEGNRKDESLLFNTCSLDFHAKINEVLAEYTPKYGDMFPSFNMDNHSSFVSKVQRTPPKGGFHSWHPEHGSSWTTLHRTLVWTLYLNDVPEGEGETEFLEYGLKVQPKKARLCYFPAGWTHTHRGNPVYTTTKYIATGWYQFS
tara:strand:- start:3526 stop:4113 length:588 start_codon:yes stop_codon:yes gene_type:complete